MSKLFFLIHYTPYLTIFLLNSLSGIWKLEFRKQRQLPTHTDDITCETIHESVFQQKAYLEKNKAGKELLENFVANRQTLVRPLANFEEEFRRTWVYESAKVVEK